MNDNTNAPLKKPVTIVYACSGCSDAGETADRIARQLTREGAAEMSCLAGIGGRVKSLLRKGEQAERIRHTTPTNPSVSFVPRHAPSRWSWLATSMTGNPCL